MQLEHAIVALWIISSMLACWAFSLVVRWWSDSRARRMDRLSSQYSRRSKMLAAMLIFLCLLGAGIAGTSALLFSSQPGVGSMRLTSLGAIGVGMVLFAGFLVVWAGIGDRARGRKRCPHCWYDMSDSEGRPCPECGRATTHEKQLSRTRHPRWAFIVAVLFFISGSIGIGFNGKLRNQGFAGFVPSSLLLSNWERMPENWVHKTRTGSDQHTLTERIRLGLITESQRRSFVESLIDEMLDDPMKRWDYTRMSLLQACKARELRHDPDAETDSAFSIWKPGSGRLEELYRACIEDILTYHQRENQPMDPDLAMRLTDVQGMTNGHTHQIVRAWLLASTAGSDTGFFMYYRWMGNQQVSYLQSLLGDLPTRFQQLHDDLVYTGSDVHLANELRQIEREIGVLRRRLPGLLSWYETNLQDPNLFVLSTIITGIRTLPDTDRAEINKRIRRWLADGDIELRKAALRIMQGVYAYTNDPSVKVTQTNKAEVTDLIDAIRTFGLSDERPAGTGSADYRIRNLAADTVLSIDATGEYAFPLLRDEILNPATRDQALMHTELYLLYGGEQRLVHWLDVFEDLIAHQDPRVRIWIVELMPKHVGSMHDDRLNAILKTMMEDDNREVRDEAISRGIDRGFFSG